MKTNTKPFPTFGEFRESLNEAKDKYKKDLAGIIKYIDALKKGKDTLDDLDGMCDTAAVNILWQVDKKLWVNNKVTPEGKELKGVIMEYINDKTDLPKLTAILKKYY